ncbi:MULTISPECIES: GbsR/MarR family transcriptional regulator [Paenibacillus]|uniref:MarR family transcriptional regulator n=1 Tax=Paenibacillus radicis (ex Xue et al. 2023) TaxID=2972489 RepID=A0ABT1YNY7_9BACL|nr:MarR family transcriptional regulator [Paenibacillus radicis (ex Xue et al. 2023)]MCR8634900.1 MarR family transcriptional regulator [Paenibacillus radicis (ex Xue et al. 2023)]
MKPSDHSFSSLKQQMSDHMSLSFENEGFSPLVGRIFAYLLFAAEPVSLQEMADQLGVTKAAISVQVRTLEKHLMCQKLPTSSDRKDYYYISEDFSMTAVQNSIIKMRRVLQQIESTLHLFNSLENIEQPERQSHDISKRRFIEMKELHQMFLNRLDGLEEEWNERRERLFPPSE